MAGPNKRGNFFPSSVFDIQTEDILTQDLSDIETVFSDGFAAQGDGGGGIWRVTGASGPPGTFDLDNGRAYDTVGTEFKIDSPVPNVKLFGAKGDGVTIDTAPINSALVFFGGAARFVTGTYLIDSSLVLTGSGFAISGDGQANSTIILDTAVNDDIVEINSGTDVVISDITLDGNRANQGATSRGVHILGVSSNIRIQNMRIKDVFSDAIVSDIENNGFWVTNVRLDSPGRAGIVIPTTATGSDRAAFVDNVSVTEPNEAGDPNVSAFVISGTMHLSNIRIDSSNANAFTGIRFLGDADPTKGAHGSTLSGFSIFGDGVTGSTEGVRMEATNVSVSDGYIEGVQTGVLSQPTAGPDDSVVTSVHVSGGVAGVGASFSIKSTSNGTNFIGCTSLDAPLIGFRNEGGDQILFDGCVARDSLGDGFRVDAGSESTVMRDSLSAGCLTGIRNDVTALDTRIQGHHFDANTTDFTGQSEEVIHDGAKLRTVASATSIPITSIDRVLRITGLTQIDNIIGAVPGQTLIIVWDVGATFGLKQLVGGAGTGQMDLLQGGGDPFSAQNNDTITLSANDASPEPDWLETSRSINTP